MRDKELHIPYERKNIKLVSPYKYRGMEFEKNYRWNLCMEKPAMTKSLRCPPKQVQENSLVELEHEEGLLLYIGADGGFRWLSSVGWRFS